jgi:hypothetical protein
VDIIIGVIAWCWLQWDPKLGTLAFGSSVTDSAELIKMKRSQIMSVTIRKTNKLSCWHLSFVEKRWAWSMSYWLRTCSVKNQRLVFAMPIAWFDCGGLGFISWSILRLI